MIDITIFEDRVEVESKKYRTQSELGQIHVNTDLSLMIGEIIDKAKFSGESITLWMVEGEMKYLLREW